MKTLVAANQKGGVGKTATLVHLAFDFVERRRLRVAVIDLDTQGNASFTLSECSSAIRASQLFAPAIPDLPAPTAGPGMVLIPSDTGLPNVERLSLAAAGQNFRASIDALADKGFDVCLIDTAPSLGVTMAAALVAADFVLSPIELEAYSMQGIKKLLTTIANIRKANPSLRFLGMVPSKVDARNPRHGRHLRELAEAYPALLMPVAVGLRSSIADALASCVPVWKIRRTAARRAAKEIRDLAALVYQQMEMPA